VLSANAYKNQVIFFADGVSALEYLTTIEIKPFLIISDINMPLMDGFELRERILKDGLLSGDHIPYIFLTTGDSNLDHIKKAFALSIQGYFVKPDSYPGFITIVDNFVRYWKYSLSPVSVNFTGKRLP